MVLHGQRLVIGGQCQIHRPIVRSTLVYHTVLGDTFLIHLLFQVETCNMICVIVFMYSETKGQLSIYVIEYANQVWSPRLKKHIDMIENVQKRATKQMP